MSTLDPTLHPAGTHALLLCGIVTLAACSRYALVDVHFGASPAHIVVGETTTTYALVARWGGQELRAETTVVVDETVSEPEREPEPEPIEAPTAMDAAFVAAPGDRLAVDPSPLASDPDGDALTFSVVTGPSFGTADVA